MPPARVRDPRGMSGRAELARESGPDAAGADDTDPQSTVPSAFLAGPRSRGSGGRTSSRRQRRTLMSACMARKEDPLEPILAVVTDGLRRGPDRKISGRGVAGR